MNTGDPLRAAALAAIQCLAVDERDRVLIVSNPPQRTIAEALREAAQSRTTRVRLLEFPALSRHGEEPPDNVTCGFEQATVVLAPTVYSLSHTQTRIRASSRGVRVAGMSSLDEAAFTAALPVDYTQLTETAQAVAAALTTANTSHITSPAGTDLHLQLQGRRAHADSGDLQGPGAFGNLPGGEAYIAPLEAASGGTLVIDGSLAGYGLLHELLSINLRGGRIIDAAGEAAEWLLQTLDSGGDGGRTLAELGIGVNPGATLTGVSIVDEKARGTAHLAFGTNTSFGGANSARVHIDGVLLNPTVRLDGHVLIEDGRLRIGSEAGRR
jgi:leucyl aminopeptidase (aminopeptidase T)